MTKNLKDNLRWLIILPTSFLTSLLTIALLIFIGDSIANNIKDLNPSILISILSICVVSAWLFTPYFIAPKHKENTVWFFWFIGCVIACFLAFLVYEESHAKEDKILSMVFLGTSIIYGLIISLKLQNETSFTDFIEKEIKTTHL